MTQLLLRDAPVAVLLDDAAWRSSPLIPSLLTALGLPVVRVGEHAATLSAPTVGLFGSHLAEVPGCYGWFVGSGSTPGWMHPSRRTAVEVLQVLGTALAQERAAAAFRAVGAGLSVPIEMPFDREVLEGVSWAVQPREEPTEPLPAPHLDVDALLRSCFSGLDRCCHPSGAIAAAPRGGPGEPDYWFFWQRDAAAAAIALSALSRTGPADVRARALQRVEGYLAYVERLGRQDDLSASRWSMEGVRVSGYGDPQYDGPASTVLAVLTADPSALTVAQPFVELLLRPGDRRGYDLWELIRGRSFHAANLRRRALRLVAQLSGGALADRCAVADERADFDDGAGGWVHVLDPEPAWFGALSRLDVSAVGSCLLAYRPGDVDDPRLRRTVERLERHYADRWPINVSWRRAGMGIGRFPEDSNDGIGSTGGNPWPIATLWLAQYHLRRGDRATALGYLEFVLAHGGSSEQIDGFTGRPRGARDLAWAQAELIVTVLGLSES